VLENAFGALIAAVVLAVAGYLYKVITGKVKISLRSFVEYLKSIVIVIFRWIVRNWKLFIGLSLLIVISYWVFVFVGSVWSIIITFGFALAVIVLTDYISKNLGHKEARAVAFVPIILVSGEMGMFSDSPNGPWIKPVECDPPYPTWPKIAGAKWVWIKERPSDQEAQRGQTVYHRFTFKLPQRPDYLSVAKLTLTVDDYVKININGIFLRRVTLVEGVVEIPIANYLRQGKNVVEMEIENVAMSGKTGFDNPSGIIYRFDIL